MHKRNHITGVFKYLDNTVFAKLFLRGDFSRELKGYELISKHYPVPELLKVEDHGDDTGLMIYKYDESIGENKGLLIDLFNNSEYEPLKLILNTYKKVFSDTLEFQETSDHDIFYKDRINTRLKDFYDKEYFESFDGKEIVLNGRKIVLNPTIIVNEVKDYFKRDQKKEWCIVSQCDPGDLNIGTKPIWLDYLAAGHIPLMAELACFTWWQLIQNDLLSPKYYPTAFKDHKKIYKNLNEVKEENSRFIYKPKVNRESFYEDYINQVISPCLKEIKQISSLYEDFKNYFAMRVLGAIDISKLSQHEQLVCLALLQKYYEKDILEKPEDFVTLFKTYE